MKINDKSNTLIEKTIMFEMYTPNGNNLSVTKEGSVFKVKVDNFTFFETTSYEKAREVLIG